MTTDSANGKKAIKNVKLKLYPNSKQERVLALYERELRRLHNASVAQYRESCENARFHKFIQNVEIYNELQREILNSSDKPNGVKKKLEKSLKKAELVLGLFAAINFIKTAKKHPNGPSTPIETQKYLNEKVNEAISALNSGNGKKPDFILVEEAFFQTFFSLDVNKDYDKKTLEEKIKRTLRAPKQKLNNQTPLNFSSKFSNQFNKANSPSSYSQQKELTQIKKSQQHKTLGLIPSVVLCSLLDKVDLSVKAFFKKNGAGLPHYKTKEDNVSISFKNGFKLIHGTNVYIKIKPAHAREDKSGLYDLGELNARIWGKGELTSSISDPFLTLSLKKEVDGWYAVISVDKGQQIKKTSSVRKDIGIDLGVKNHVTVSKSTGTGLIDSGSYQVYPKEVYESDKVIKGIQKRISRMKPGSNNRAKAQKKLSIMQAKLARRKDYFIKLVAKEISREAGMGTVKMEDLRVKNMTASAKGDSFSPGKNVAQKSGLNREILFRNFGALRQKIKEAVISSGGNFVLVNPKNTSRTCFDCKFTSKDNRISQSEFVCQQCGHTDNADVNAAKNILVAESIDESN